MRARAFHIDGRLRTDLLAIADVSDFAMHEEGEIGAELLLKSPRLSLYCLDDAGRRAIFVETPEGVELRNLPFFYQAQFQHAQRLLALPYADFLQLADAVGEGRHALAVLYSVGRCGSTLLSRGFDCGAAAASLSEPDVPSQITGLRETSGKRDAELTALLRAALRLQFHGAAQSHQAAVWVLKPRSFCVETADLLHAAFPAARLVFLYRNAEDWARSAARAFQILKAPAGGAARSRYPLYRLVPLLRTFSPKLADLDAAVKFLTLMWLSPMQRALELQRAGTPLLPVRYEDLLADRLAMMTALFDYCGVWPAAAERACRAFDSDSQADSVLSRRQLASADCDELSHAQLQQLREILRQHPEIRVSDFVIPGSLVVRRAAAT